MIMSPLFLIVVVLLIVIVVMMFRPRGSSAAPRAGNIDLDCPHCQKPTPANQHVCQHCGEELR